MQFTLINPKSPGSKFNEYTDNIILFCNDLLNSKTEEIGSYKSIRVEMEKSGVSKDTYLRNVFSFLRNCGFVFYEKGEIINYKKFFTELGKNYIEVLKSEKVLKETPLGENKQKTVYEELAKIKSLLILEGIKNVMLNEECTYNLVFKELLQFLYLYKSIDESEFAFLLYKSQKNELTDFTLIKNEIEKYRNNELELNFKTEKTKEIESGTDNSGKVPSFGYFLDIFAAANIVYKENKEKRYYLNEKTLDNTKNTLGGAL